MSIAFGVSCICEISELDGGQSDNGRIATHLPAEFHHRSASTSADWHTASSMISQNETYPANEMLSSPKGTI